MASNMVIQLSLPSAGTVGVGLVNRKATSEMREVAHALTGKAWATQHLPSMDKGLGLVPGGKCIGNFYYF